MSVPIAMVAGEASGDLLASLLLGALKQKVPGLAAFGIGGPRMIAEGFRADWPIDKLAVRGYVEVLRHYLEIAGIRRQLKRRLLDHPPAAFVGIDAPDFNLDLEVRLREAWRGQGRPVIHFIGPSIWAWRGKRIAKIARAVDHILVVFPFEEDIYRKAGIAATYVGHPLADVIPMDPDRTAARRALGVPDGERVVALLPGSRLSEIAYLAETFVDAAALLHRRDRGLCFLVPMASSAARAAFEKIRAARHPDLPLRIVDGRSHAVLAASDAVLVASGTATLETALFKRPMVIAYKVNALTAAMMRRMGYIPWVGLPNILAREFLVPEFLQEAATPAGPGGCPRVPARRRGEPRTARDALSRDARDAELQHRRAGGGRDLVAARRRGEVTVARNRTLSLRFFTTATRVCGVDEAGRGPLAGPVYAAAVILDPDRPIRGLRDSKVLAAAKREVLAMRIREKAMAWSVASASVEEIDTINILQASLLAMRRAVEGLSVVPEHVLVDGNQLPRWHHTCEAVVRGDSKVAAISAASILAKTARDALMRALHEEHPEYGFDQHVGYATRQHLASLALHGASAIHRRSFAPVRAAIDAHRCGMPLEIVAWIDDPVE